MTKVWVVNLVEESETWAFSTLEKAYHFMHMRARKLYEIWDKDTVDDLINELHEDFLADGLRGYGFGVNEFGFAEVVNVDEELE